MQQKIWFLLHDRDIPVNLWIYRHYQLLECCFHVLISTEEKYFNIQNFLLDGIHISCKNSTRNFNFHLWKLMFIYFIVIKKQTGALVRFFFHSEDSLLAIFNTIQRNFEPSYPMRPLLSLCIKFALKHAATWGLNFTLLRRLLSIRNNLSCFEVCGLHQN